MGPVDQGGGWLTIDGIEVDLLYRDMRVVRKAMEDCQAGQFSMNYQVGHPHGFCSTILVGEAALALPLHDPHGAFGILKAEASVYPGALKETIVAKFGWEVGFAIENGELAARRGDRTHVAGCAYRALTCLAQVLFALNEQYLINEKGAIRIAAGLPITIPSLAASAKAIWEAVGEGRYEDALGRLNALCTRMRELSAECQQSIPQ